MTLWFLEMLYDTSSEHVPGCVGCRPGTGYRGSEVVDDFPMDHLYGESELEDSRFIKDVKYR
jgi:hypothetical protein